MGLLDLLTGGKKPQRRGPTATESNLIRATDRLDASRGGLSNIVNLQADTLASGRRGARSDFLGAGAADLQQSVSAATSNAGAVDNALRRGKGLSRIAQSRVNDFDSQLLRDRVAFTSNVASRRGRGLGAIAGAAGVQEGVASASYNTKLAKDASRANMVGTLAGIGAGFASQGTFGRMGGNANQGVFGGDTTSPSSGGVYA